MNIAIMSRDDEYSKHIETTLNQLIESQGLNRNDEQPDVVIFVGGDGTFYGQLIIFSQSKWYQVYWRSYWITWIFL